jgi:hypothetical protein
MEKSLQDNRPLDYQPSNGEGQFGQIMTISTFVLLAVGMLFIGLSTDVGFL